MNIRFLHLLLTLSIATFSIACKQEREFENQRKKPNIVLILADDLGYGDLSCYGQELFSTPHIDQLAADGILFTQHYSGSTVCAPSRSSLITGFHTGHTYIRGNKEVQPEGQHPLADSVYTLLEHLQSNGYITGAFGKWGLGFPGSSGDPMSQGVDRFYGYNCQRIGHNYYPYHMWDNNKKEVLPDNIDTLMNTYGPDIIHQEAIRFIEQNKDTSFFLYYPSIIPHAELVAPDQFMAKFSGKYDPEVPYNGIDEGKHYKNGGYMSQKEPHAAFAAMISILDEQVGEIRSKLEELGIAQNTLIIFTSDNGPHREGGADPDYFNSNGPLRGYKRDLYEGGIRVPFIAAWPGKITPGQKSKHISAFWDIFPTICHVAELETPSHLDGISFLPSLFGQSQQTHDYLYWEFLEKGGKQAVRWKNWKGVRLKMGNDPDADIQLFDLSKDLEEKHDVSGGNLDIVRVIDSLMIKAHTKSDDFPFGYEGSK